MEYIIKPTNAKITLPKRGYFSIGDTGPYIAIISSFLAVNFMGFEYKTKVKIDDMLGEVFGKNLQSWVKEFQRVTNIEIDGYIGPITLNKMREYGLNA